MAKKLVSPMEAAAPGALFTPTIMTMFARISHTYPAFFPLGRHQKDPKFGLIKLGFQLTVTSIPFSVRGRSNIARTRPQITFHALNQMPGFYRKIYRFLYSVYFKEDLHSVDAYLVFSFCLCSSQLGLALDLQEDHSSI